MTADDRSYHPQVAPAKNHDDPVDSVPYGLAPRGWQQGYRMILGPVLGLLTLRQGLLLVQKTALILALVALFIAHCANRLLSADPAQRVDPSEWP
jgi:hypothetical protein